MKSRIVASMVTAAIAALGLACGGPDRSAQDPASGAINPERSTEQERGKASSTRDQSSVTQTTSGTSTTVFPEVGRPADGRPAGPAVVNPVPSPVVPLMPSLNEPRSPSSSATTSSDNTRINQRDRHGTLTPMDQGNSAAETKITALIRKGMMNNSALSFTAKNVKVITIGSKVTLRGPVKSDQEKATIAELARSTDGVSEVDNQLETKK